MNKEFITSPSPTDSQDPVIIPIIPETETGPIQPNPPSDGQEVPGVSIDIVCVNGILYSSENVPIGCVPSIDNTEAEVITPTELPATGAKTNVELSAAGALFLTGVFLYQLAHRK